ALVASETRPATVNGLAGFVIREPDGSVDTVAFEACDGRIAAIYLTRNPDKLRHVRFEGGPEPTSRQASGPRTSERVSRAVEACPRAGLPKAAAPAGTSRVTTLPAPISASSPMDTPGRTMAPAPIQTLRPMWTGRPSSRPEARTAVSRGWSAA